MKFEYQRAETVDHALELLSGNDGSLRILAGGTDLLVMIQEKLISPRSVLDISGLEDLKKIEEDSGLIRLGALASHERISTSPLLGKKALPLVQSTLASMKVRMIKVRRVEAGAGRCHMELAVRAPISLDPADISGALLKVDGIESVETP